MSSENLEPPQNFIVLNFCYLSKFVNCAFQLLNYLNPVLRLLAFEFGRLSLYFHPFINRCREPRPNLKHRKPCNDHGLGEFRPVLLN